MDEENIIEKIGASMATIQKPNFLARIFSAVSYLGVLCFLPIILKIKSDFVRFHARQGLVLFLAEIIFTLIWIIPFFGWVVGLLGWSFSLIASLIGFFTSLIGKQKRIIIIHRFIEKVKI